MKMTKRFFIALLIVSVIVSVFAFSASADEAVLRDYSYVLEYYEEPTLIYNNYADEELDAWTSLIAKRAKTLGVEYVSDENAPGGRYLSLSVASAENKLEAYGDNHVFLSWSSDSAIDDFILNMTVSGSCGTGREQNLPRVIVAVGDEEYTDPAIGAASGTTLLALDYRRGSLYYLKTTLATNGELYGVETEAPFALTADTWYDVSLSYDVDKSAMTVTVTEWNNPANTYTIDDAFIPCTEIKNVRVGAYGEDYGSARGSIINFAGVYALGGLYQRDPYNSQADMENILLSLYEDFMSDAADTEYRIAMCDVVVKMLGYGFTTENSDVQQVLDRLCDGIIGFFNQEMADCIASYMELPTYEEKRTVVDRCLGYVGELENMSLDGLPAEYVDEINANISGIREADAYLLGVKDNCEWFIDEVAGAKNCNLFNYTELSSYLLTINYYTPDPTYPGIDEYYSFYLKMLDSMDRIETQGTRFIELVGVASDAALDINLRADAYRELEVAYYDNETYPGMSEALAVYHDDLVPNLGTTIDKAENFVKYVSRADYSIYISAKQENLDIAQMYASCHPEYKGVSEAKLLMAEVQKFIDEQTKNARAYISSVNALDALVDDALVAGIEKAKALQSKGNVLGVDGVTEANVKLDKIIASVELRDKYCNYFINLVNSIDTKKSAEEIYPLIVEAKAAELNADPSYEGVCDASAKLGEIIAEYNKRVNEVNTEFTKASETAANTSGVGKDVNTVADRVIAFIKKLFGED